MWLWHSWESLTIKFLDKNPAGSQEGLRDTMVSKKVKTCFGKESIAFAS